MVEYEQAMPAKDRIHDIVVRALRKDGWRIEREQPEMSLEGNKIYIDILAERTLITAERDAERIAVEVKGFTGPSEVVDLRDAIGQYMLYRSVLPHFDPDRTLFLAVDETTATTGILNSLMGRNVLHAAQVNVVIIDIVQEEVVSWMPWHFENM
jgi:hypothetical protein